MTEYENIILEIRKIESLEGLRTIDVAFLENIEFWLSKFHRGLFAFVKVHEYTTECNDDEWLDYELIVYLKEAIEFLPLFGKKFKMLEITDKLIEILEETIKISTEYNYDRTYLMCPETKNAMSDCPNKYGILLFDAIENRAIVDISFTIGQYSILSNKLIERLDAFIGETPFSELLKEHHWNM